MRKVFRRLWRLIKRHWKAIIIWGVGGLFIFGGLIFIWAATLKIPDLTSLESRKVDQSVKIYDRTGTVLLYDLNSNAQRTVVPLAQISQNVQNATIAVEDPTFYQNPGIDPKAILRAIVADVTTLSLSQGGSTITQQVVKNTILTDSKTFTRKIEEWILSLKLARALTKEQVLELYLNQAPYGGSIYGVEEASETFFGVHASDVTLSEAAYLAAIINAPTYYSPYGTHRSALDARKNLVLQLMYQHGYITQTQEQDAQQAQVTFLTPKTTSIVAPHFVFYVEQYLEQKYGQDAVETGGWSVITTLDADLQQKAESIVQAHADSQEQKFNASNTGMIALDPTNGQILVMVGSRNYFDTQIDGNFNVTLAGRQPGSTFKPFAYAEAFEKGYTPNTVLFDLPTQFSTACAPSDNTNDTPPCYSPQNYDNEFRGPMTLRDALAQSINVPSVKVLYLAGISDTLQLAKSMGISTLGDPSQYGLTLVLGGGEVTLLDMTSAYGAFATNGVHYPPTAIMQIKDGGGNIIEDDTHPEGTTVLPQTIAEEINDILSDPVARAPLGENEYLEFPSRDVAVKTGTTNNYKDAWTIGYTPNLVMGMWAGNNDDTPMSHQVSGFILGPMWNEFMSYALPDRPNQAFTRGPEPPSPKPALNGDWQIAGSDGSVHELLYWVDRSDPAGPVPTNPADDAQFQAWDYPVEQWARTHGWSNLPPNNPQTIQMTTPVPNSATNSSTPLVP